MKSLVLVCCLIALIVPTQLLAQTGDESRSTIKLTEIKYLTSREIEIDLEELHERDKRGRLQKFMVNSPPERGSRGRVGMFFVGEKIMVRPGSAGYKVYDPQSQTARYKRAQKPKYKTKFHPSKTISPSDGVPAVGAPMQAVVDGGYQVSLLNWERLFPSPVSDRPNFSSVDLRRHYVEFLGGAQFRVLPFTVLHVQAFDRGEYASQRKAESPTDTKQANDVQSAPPLKKTNGRAWTAEKVSGHFVKIDGEQVIIRMSYGRRRKLEFDKLTDEDVSFIEKKTGQKLR